jgi:hypothetical protein
MEEKERRIKERGNRRKNRERNMQEKERRKKERGNRRKMEKKERRKKGRRVWEGKEVKVRT